MNYLLIDEWMSFQQDLVVKWLFMVTRLWYFKGVLIYVSMHAAHDYTETTPGNNIMNRMNISSLSDEGLSSLFSGYIKRKDIYTTYNKLTYTHNKYTSRVIREGTWYNNIISRTINELCPASTLYKIYNVIYAHE